MVRLIFFLLFSIWQGPALAQASPLLIEQSFLHDPRAQFSVDEVVSASFKRFSGSLGLGFQSGPVWARLKIDATGGVPGTAQPVVLRIGPNYLDRIELYAPLNGQWLRQVRGALTPQASQACPDDMHCFSVEASATEATTVYLRVLHEGFLAAQIEVLTPDDLPFAVAKRVRAITVSMVVALALLALGCVLLLTDRSLLMLAYCGFQAVIVLFIASNAGLLARAFPAVSPELLKLISGLLYVVRVALTGLLAWAVLRPHRPSRRYLLGIRVMVALCVVNAVLVLSGHLRLALEGSLLIFSLTPLWHLYGARTATDLPRTQRRVLVVGLSVYIVMLTLGLWVHFMDQALMPSANPIKQIIDWRLNGFAIGLVFFWITMLERSSQKKGRAQELELLRERALLASKRKAQLDESSALIDMLTHELKNPLGTVRFALAALKRKALGDKDWLTRIQSIDVSARRMDDLIERVAHFNKIERTVLAEIPETLDPATLLQDLLADAARPEQWDLQVEPGASFHCDRQLLLVILENLITNASKYSLRDQQIRVEVLREKGGPTANSASSEGASAQAPGASGYTRFEISNAVDPAAVPEESRLFERYYRHPNVQNQSGMGLGLSVVKSAAQKIGAEVAYRYAQGRVCFTLRVPA